MADAPKSDATRVVNAKRVWTTLITNNNYLSGLLTLDYSLKKHGSKYPLVALYTDSFPEEGHRSLDLRNIPKRLVKFLSPSVHKEYANDTRFHDCWSKLSSFSLVEYDRIVQLDSDMLVVRNMDELMDLELDPPSTDNSGKRVFAASHACCCNPLKREHYPKSWIPENCAFSSQHSDPDNAQVRGASPSASLGMLNSGLLVINPSDSLYEAIIKGLTDSSAVESYEFADQSILSDLFEGRWVTLPYVYNALKTLRLEGVHSQIWRDQEVKNIHYIFSRKPWTEKPGESNDETHRWWWTVNLERLSVEREVGIDDGY